VYFGWESNPRTSISKQFASRDRVISILTRVLPYTGFTFDAPEVFSILIYNPYIYSASDISNKPNQFSSSSRYYRCELLIGLFFLNTPRKTRLFEFYDRVKSLLRRVLPYTVFTFAAPDLIALPIYIQYTAISNKPNQFSSSSRYYRCELLIGLFFLHT